MTLERAAEERRPGEGVFETIRVREGRVPLLEAHLERLSGAVAALGLPMPDRLAASLREHARQGERVVRVSVAADGVRLEARAVPPIRDWQLITAAVAHQPYPFKRTRRAVFDGALAAAHAAGADEAILFTADGWLAEGAISAVGFWTAEALCLPALELGVLPGVGRGRLELVARAAGFGVVEGRWRRAELAGRSLVAVNAVRGVTAATGLDGLAAPADGRTAQLAEAFWPDHKWRYGVE